MLHIDLNLTPAIEQQFLSLVQQQFQGSFEAFIQDSLNKLNRPKMQKLSDVLLAPEIDIDDDLFARNPELSREIDL